MLFKVAALVCMINWTQNVQSRLEGPEPAKTLKEQLEYHLSCLRTLSSMAQEAQLTPQQRITISTMIVVESHCFAVLSNLIKQGRCNSCMVSFSIT